MPQTRKNRSVLLLALSVVFLMGAMAYASVPLYRLFCQVTGYGGTTQRAGTAPVEATDVPITIRFNADINQGLPWEFSPLQPQMTLNIGQTGLAFYKAHNLSNEAITGTAIYNVTPFEAGPYFHKIHCFCFEEQVLKAGQAMDMPVQFYVDPAILNDPHLKNVRTITLSYTFFKATD